MSTDPKYALFEEFATIARALGHPYRLELLEQLAQGERGVEALAEKIGFSVANCSQHLQQLRRAGLVTSRRDGKFVLYSLADDQTLVLLAQLHKLAERNIAEVDRILGSFFANRDSMEAISRDDLLERSKQGLVTVLDVRPEDEFSDGHLPNALNIPLEQLPKRIAELDPAQEIVAYCRGSYCVLSFDAVAELRRHGFQARRLEEGFPEWKLTGLPVEQNHED